MIKYKTSLSSLVLALFSVGYLLLAYSCNEEANILTLPVDPDFNGTAAFEWNGEAMDLRARAKFATEDSEYITVTFARFVGDLNSRDISGTFWAINPASLGDTLLVTPINELSIDSVDCVLTINDGDSILEGYRLRDDRDNWVVLTQWDPVTLDLDLSFSLNFRRNNPENLATHPNAADQVRIVNASLRATVTE